MLSTEEARLLYVQGDAAHDFDHVARVAALAEEILHAGDERIRGLITVAGNPVLSTPNGRQLDEALASLEFMAGRRARYVHPFKLYFAICIALFVVLAFSGGHHLAHGIRMECPAAWHQLLS